MSLENRDVVYVEVDKAAEAVSDKTWQAAPGLTSEGNTIQSLCTQVLAAEGKPKWSCRLYVFNGKCWTALQALKDFSLLPSEDPLRLKVVLAQGKDFSMHGLLAASHATQLNGSVLHDNSDCACSQDVRIECSI